MPKPPPISTPPTELGLPENTIVFCKNGALHVPEQVQHYLTALSFKTSSITVPVLRQFCNVYNQHTDTFFEQI